MNLAGRLPWPLPALLAWCVAWALHGALAQAAAPALLGLALPMLLGVVLASLVATPWRRLIVAGGFPLSLAVTGAAAAVPTWAWLLPLVALALLYPARAWRDAPLFPTPAGALDGLADALPLPGRPHVLDAGCGLGAGLRELRRAYPHAHLHGIEWSRPLQWLCALRCRDATIRQGDLWRADWSGYDLVYLFQRPESLPRAIEKARRELRPGAWLASLEFEAAGATPARVLTCRDGRRLFLYQAPFSG